MDGDLTNLDLTKFRVVELKAELSKRGLPVSGKKNDLVERLQLALSADAQARKAKETESTIPVNVPSVEPEIPHNQEFVAPPAGVHDNSIESQVATETQEETVDPVGDSKMMVNEPGSRMDQKEDPAQSTDIQLQDPDQGKNGSSASADPMQVVPSKADSESAPNADVASQPAEEEAKPTDVTSQTADVTAASPPEPNPKAVEKPAPSPAKSGRSGIPVLDLDEDDADDMLDYEEETKKDEPEKKEEMKKEEVKKKKEEQPASKAPPSKESKKREAADAVSPSGAEESRVKRVREAAPGARRLAAPLYSPRSAGGGGGSGAAGAGGGAVGTDGPKKDEESRVVPPSASPPSQALRIDNFLRPFTKKMVLDLLGQHGTIQDDGFWMNAIKSHCYVIYKEKSQAVATRDALYNLVWPKQHGKKLVCHYVGLAEAEKVIKDGGATAATAATSTSGNPAVPSPSPTGSNANVLAATAVNAARAAARAVPARSPPARVPTPGDAPGSRRHVPAEPEEPMSLDDLFRKTKAKPPLYFLPLTAAQIEEKRKKVLAMKAGNNATAKS